MNTGSQNLFFPTSMANPEAQKQDLNTFTYENLSWGKDVPWSKEELVVFIKNDLYKLTEIDKIENSTVKEMERTLKNIESTLGKLLEAYPNDPDLQILQKFYLDLKTDFNQHIFPDLDDSFEELMWEMQNLLAKSNFRTETPDNTVLSHTVEQLRSIGIEPAYIVTQGDPQAKTIVFFLQLHPRPKDDNVEGDPEVKASQKEIYTGIKAAQAAGLTRTVYSEGWYAGREINLEGIPREENMNDLSYNQAEIELGEDIDSFGTEDMPLMEQALKGEYPEIKYRSTAHNILIAHNIDEHFGRSKEQLAFLVFGAAHETYSFLPRREEHPLPLSHLLAYEGYNVIVVDATSPYFNLGGS